MIDAHHHMWAYSEAAYPWMGPRHAAIKRDFLPSDIKSALDTATFSGSVAVQARQTLEETEWLLHLSKDNDWIQGVVGWVDLRAEPEVLKSQLDLYCSHPTSKLKGVRHVIHDEPEDDFMLSPEFRRGIAALSTYSLTYDLLLFPRHLPNAVKLVQEFPSQAFVLDHLGNPPVVPGATEPPQQWLNDLKALAACPNVFCKISGLVTNWKGEGEWKKEYFHPVISAVLQAFTPSRCVSMCLFFGRERLCVCVYVFEEAGGILFERSLYPFHHQLNQPKTSCPPPPPLIADDWK